uniref:ATP-dependent DNA helicase n=1 Tax=Cacopsylla melanoneura TaxID=428564 RepID=A0A8D8TWJ5_9HEMI
MEEPSSNHLDVLKKQFGHSSFKPMQWKIIHSILEEKKDNCVVMATGYGKSLCYQYPAVYSGGVSIVISPLISLMEDQVLNLKMNNIPACYLGSAQTQKGKVLDEILSGQVRVVYMTPEYVTVDPSFLSRIPNVVLIAIDEAHCVSQWGHDFRPSYRNLSVLRETLPRVPMLAVTATATSVVMDDICTNLELKDPNIINTGFDRPNLYLAASIKQPDIMADLKKLTSFDNQFPGSTIIYCPTIAICQKICDVLTYNKIQNRPYHSEISLKQRKEIHQLFVKDVIKVVVATCAFGMGIDKPDVRCVIHYGAPKDLSAYYQEIGRAGRDGLGSVCYTFYKSTDFTKNSMIFQSSSNDADIQAFNKTMMKRVETYLELRSCRRKFLLDHFNGSISNSTSEVPPDKCCDNCKNQTSSKVISLVTCDLVEQVTNFLHVVNLMKGKFGLGAYIKFIRGTTDGRINEGLKSNSLYGAGKRQSENWWKALARLCLRENLVTEKTINSGGGGGGFRQWGSKMNYSIYEVSPLGKFFIQKGSESGIVLTPSAEMLELETIPRGLKLTVENPDVWMNKNQTPNLEAFVCLPHLKTEDVLFKRLQALRTTLAEEESCLRYMIVTEKQLLEMANRKAKTKQDLLECGLTEHKLNKFGRRFLEVIYEVCEFKECLPELNEQPIESMDGNKNSPYFASNQQESGANDAASKGTQDSGDTQVETTENIQSDEWGDDAFFDKIDYNELEQSISQDDKSTPQKGEPKSSTSLDDEDNIDTFFDEIDYNELDKSISNETKITSKGPKTECNSSSTSCHDKQSTIQTVTNSCKKVKLGDGTGHQVETESCAEKLSVFKFETKTINSNLSTFSTKNTKNNMPSKPITSSIKNPMGNSLSKKRPKSKLSGLL